MAKYFAASLARQCNYERMNVYTVQALDYPSLSSLSSLFDLRLPGTWSGVFSERIPFLQKMEFEIRTS